MEQTGTHMFKLAYVQITKYSLWNSFKNKYYKHLFQSNIYSNTNQQIPLIYTDFILKDILIENYPVSYKRNSSTSTLQCLKLEIRQQLSDFKTIGNLTSNYETCDCVIY